MGTNFITGANVTGTATSGTSSPVRAINRPFNESVLFPVLTSDRLLVSVQRKKILEELRALSDAPEAYYEALYKELINNFVEFVQVLPVNNEARLCSLMDEGLLRALFVSQLNKTYAEPLEPVMVYVFFSAALLFDIGSVLEDRTVVVSDTEGGYVSEWYPFAGPMLPEDGQYKIRRGGGMSSWVCRRATAILARQIMPPAGFDWIASDPFVLNTWLALLAGDKEGAGALAFSFWHIFETLEEFKRRMEYLLFELIELEEAKEAEETMLAEEFIAWLKRGLKDGTISVNKISSNVQKLKVDKREAILLKAGVFKEFGKGTPAAVVKQLQKIGAVGDLAKFKVALAKEAAAQQKVGGTLFKISSPVNAEGMPAGVEQQGVLIKDFASKIILQQMATEYAALAARQVTPTAEAAQQAAPAAAAPIVIGGGHIPSSAGVAAAARAIGGAAAAATTAAAASTQAAVSSTPAAGAMAGTSAAISGALATTTAPPAELPASYLSPTGTISGSMLQKIQEKIEQVNKLLEAKPVEKPPTPLDNFGDKGVKEEPIPPGLTIGH